jgi:HK97 gp10 family phage protein
MTTVNVKGLAELQKLLDTLPAKLEANAMRAALAAGARVIRDEAKANVPVKTGTLRAGLKVSTRSRRGVVTATVKAGGKHAYLANWIEFGTAAHFIKPKTAKSLFIAGLFSNGVAHPGVQPKPFMRPALDSQAGAAVVAVGEYLKKRLSTKHGLDTAAIEIEET